ncbi:hypothetical protein CTAYLR_001231 [Chrysophaeum taylorii]|uniref:Potassium channel tetramerisation-type BTB domain-containing protein n=1 Tax=Chrysophaeum taylorii TaxID=2483200 RepID=A0AAD7UCI4_9STRA|nr:hypothetical protein CTAYLR_001231 [Chrysophaeum taylorii]
MQAIITETGLVVDVGRFRYILSYLRTGELEMPPTPLECQRLLREARFYELDAVVSEIENHLAPRDPIPWWRRARVFVYDHYLKAVGALLAKWLFNQLKKYLKTLTTVGPMEKKAEADKIVQVDAAEADAGSKYSSGVGVARQRQAIVGGLRDSILEFSRGIRGTNPTKDVMGLL